MQRGSEVYQKYIDILKEELLPAMGCTEPIALAYAAAKAREILGGQPELVKVEASGNIIKNVKSVIVPHTGHLRGIEAAAAAGIVAGDAAKELEVISDVSPDQQKAIREFLEQATIQVLPADTDKIFDIIVSVAKGEETAKVRISDFHTNITLLEKNGEILYSPTAHKGEEKAVTERDCLNVKDIVEFAQICEIEDIAPMIERQIAYNAAISDEGLRGDYGANIGQTILKMYGKEDVKILAKARAAAGSDARMNGCELPVVIVSGSGNQGITAVMPVVTYAESMGVSKEEMLRAVVVSDLLAVHLKTGIGRLSAYCGAVSAGCASGAGICFLQGGRYEEIAHTLVNAMAIASGMICDGAKASCAAKIALAVEAGILGYSMYQNGQEFKGGDGIVTKGVEATIANVGKLAHDGMRETDKEIIQIMVGRHACD
ncbi:MAG: serine dehydratase subunit alpha family protein [Lachnospiraceae bacterium]|jgi:L-cysteine desulfidase|nr:serine dehydratase subunit alpha family protein [Lachnospiraceae bacterium]